MPHTNHNNTSTQSQQQSQQNAGGSPGDDLGSTDEVKVFKDEGDREDEKISSENLLVEEKSSLIDLTESEEKSGKHSSRQDHSPVYGKLDTHSSHSFNMGYLVSPYSYTNGTAGGLPVSMANKMGLSPFFCHNGDHLTTPPPAHCGIPSYQLDPKTMGLARPAIYPFATAQYPYPMLSPDMTQVAASWHTPTMYSPASGFRSPYPSSLPINTSIPSDFYRFSPTSLLPSVHPAAAAAHHVLNSHPAIVTPGPKQDILGQDSNHRYIRSTLDQKQTSSSLHHHQPQHHNQQQDFLHHAHHPHHNSQKDNNSSINSNNSNDSKNKKPHIKKPLNAFMLYMKEMRAKVVAECTLKESAAINQILGRKWHALGREEQAKYYELARRERQLHMQMYPDWSSRANTQRSKKRKRKQDPNDAGGNNMKKCRARYGLDQQNQWCKPCRRKKKCIRYKEAENDDGSSRHDGSGGGSGRELENHVSDDNLGSCGSVGEAQTPEDDNESLNQSLSSPGCLSGLSSLQSPSTSLASPLNLLASPSTPQTLHQHHDGIGSGGGSMSGGVGGLGLTTLIDLNNAIPTLNNYQKTIKNHFNNNNNSNSQYNSKHNNNNSSSNNNNNNHNAMSTLDSNNHVINNNINNNSNNHNSSSNNNNGSSNSSSNDNSKKSATQQNGGLDRRLSMTGGSPKSTATTTTTSTTTDELLKVEIKREPNTMDSPSHQQHQQHRNSSHQSLNSSLPPPPPLVPLPADGLGNSIFDKIAAVRNPVGANPRDVNNPLNISQLTKRNFINPYHQHQSLATSLLAGGPPHPDSPHHQPSFYQFYQSMIGNNPTSGGMMSQQQQSVMSALSSMPPTTSSVGPMSTGDNSIFVSSFSPHSIPPPSQHHAAASHRHHQLLSQRHLQLQHLQQQQQLHQQHQQQNLASLNMNPHSPHTIPPSAMNSASHPHHSAANSHHNFNLALAAQLTAAAAAQHSVHFPHISPVTSSSGHNNISNSSINSQSNANGLMFGSAGSSAINHHHHNLMTALSVQQHQQQTIHKQTQQSSPITPTTSSSASSTAVTSAPPPHHRHSGEDGISVT